MLDKFHIPGVFWLALIAFVAKWLPELFPGQSWLPYVLLGLMALSKAVEVLVTSQVGAATRDMFAAQRSALSRFLL
jgi:hypothetical protein